MNTSMEQVDQTTLAVLYLNPNCVICDLKHNDKKNLDHCHYTGKVLGYTHPLCNLEHQTPKYIPIFFHNLKGYDSHEIIKALARRTQDPWDINIIPQSMESYTAFSTSKFRFIDSYAHLNASLEKLVANISTSGPAAFKPVQRFLRLKYGVVDPVKLELLLRKGVYPYSYITSFEVFDETELPPIEAFYNDLSKEACTEEDYAHAQKVWKEFDLKSLPKKSLLMMAQKTMNVVW